MRRTASSVLRDLDIRIARLERQANREAIQEAREVEALLNRKLESAGYIIENEYDYTQNAIKKHPLGPLNRVRDGEVFIKALTKHITKTLGIKNRGKRDGEYLVFEEILDGFTFTDRSFKVLVFIGTFAPSCTIRVRPV